METGARGNGQGASKEAVRTDAVVKPQEAIRAHKVSATRFNKIHPILPAFCETTGNRGKRFIHKVEIGWAREYKLYTPTVLQDENVQEIREILVLTRRLIKGEAQCLEHHPTGTTEEGFYIARVAETATV